jgi:hypothetical protein
LSVVIEGGNDFCKQIQGFYESIMSDRLLYVPLLLLITCTYAGAATAQDHSHQSPYAGQEQRRIKSLSADDIDELSRGGGWGLAKAAELNGMPGPIHLLEMKTEIGLSTQQIEEIETLYESMRQAAIPLGEKLIELETALNDQFADGTITDDSLARLLEEIGAARSQLRYVHLSAHLKTPLMVTADQIDEYNRLRGYFSDDPCANIPAGHDPQMWKMHNNCP